MLNLEKALNDSLTAHWLIYISLLLLIGGFYFALGQNGAVAQLGRGCILEDEEIAHLEGEQEKSKALCENADRRSMASAAACYQSALSVNRLIGEYCSPNSCTLILEDVNTVTNPISAISIEQFLLLASNSARSEHGEAGHFKASISYNRNGQGRVTALTAGGTMMLPEFDPVLNPTPDGPLMVKAVALVTAHEEEHRNVFINFATKACAEMTNAKGSNQKILRKYFCETGPESEAAAQKAVDMRSGQIRPATLPSGARDVVAEKKDHPIQTYLPKGDFCSTLNPKKK